MRVLFWGTPEFAVPPLRALIAAGHDIVGVVTQPDRPRERGGRSRSVLDASPVKRVAVEAGIGLLQPERPRGDEFLAALRALRPDVSVVVAYGHILRQDVIDVPRLGTFNIHASLLPAYRGAAPIQAAIRDGQAETGVTIMRLVLRMDAGPILLARSLPISADDTAGTLEPRLAELGAQAIVELLGQVAAGSASETPQDEAAATYVKKITREDAELVWERPAVQVACAIRAYDPKPGAWTAAATGEVRLYGAAPVDPPAAPAGGAAAPGTILAVDGPAMLVACGSGAVRVSEVHAAGRKRQTAAEWLRGRGAAVGDRLGHSGPAS
ncbi:MAG: methionyl-tRNA formyltransferase [Gemmatimonadetes bacterium]|nr:methionyl-tRNA formyltransferase [Gemmatimonadota bacterium]